MVIIFLFASTRAVGKGRGQGVPVSPPFPGLNSFFPHKIGKHKIFTCEEHDETRVHLLNKT